MEHTERLELKVELGERSYPIYFGENMLSDIGLTFEQHQLPKGSPVMIITDMHVAEHHLASVERSLATAGYKVHSNIVPSGERSKSLEMLGTLIGACLEAGLDRHSTIVALGGGVIGDLAGYAAASYMRGIRFVQVPTTILAHDSSVGGKVAVNHPLAKNIIGAFHQPAFVYYDIATLKTLPPREVRAGLSEVVKHGFIWDESFVHWCEENVEKLLACDSEALKHALYNGCQVKAHVVGQDERENDLRAILNLGHTIGHALEAVAGYGELLHGEAISIGMVGSALLAQRVGYSEEIHTVTKRVLAKLELPVVMPAHLDIDAIMAAMMHDKKFKEGQMVFVIPVALGKVEVNKHISVEWVREVLQQLKQEG